MDDIEIVVGTYENHLLGYRIVKNIDGTLSLETSFTDDSHRGAIRCLAISPAGVLASSSTDDSIRIHSLKKRKEIGGLFEHNGTVNNMVFYEKKFMFSASEDGTICLWQTKNWELLRTLKGHKAQVMAIAVHPSGKLGLSVGSDRSFLTWDLLTGKLAFQRKLSEAAQNVFFTPSGDHYVLVFKNKLEVCSLADTVVVKEILTEWRVNAVCHVQDNVFAVGGDSRQFLLLDVITGTTMTTLDAARSEKAEFKSRVRCIQCVSREKEKLLFVATSSGDIKAFTLDVRKFRAKDIFYDEARVRVTAMGVFSASNDKNSQVALRDVQDTVKDAVDDGDKIKPSDESGNSESETQQSTTASAQKPKKRKLDDSQAQGGKKKKKKKLSRNGSGLPEGNVLKKSKNKKGKPVSPTSPTKKTKTGRKNKNL